MTTAECKDAGNTETVNNPRRCFDMRAPFDCRDRSHFKQAPLARWPPDGSSPDR